jgi:Tat protein translocase TatB subunit
MFGIGMPEMILILVVALIVLGPQKLPDIAKSMGRAMLEFRKAASEFKESMGIDTEMKEVRKAFDEMNSDLKKAVDMKPDSAASIPVRQDRGKDVKQTAEDNPADIAVKEKTGEDACSTAALSPSGNGMLSEKRKNEEKP